MRRFGSLAFIALFTFALPGRSDVAIPPVVQVLGSVTNAARPVADALIIALNLRDLAAIQTHTGADGTFALPPLPSGIYKIIAVKAGFTPAIATVVPTRQTHKVTLSIDPEKADRRSANREIWEIRASLPKDILRELDELIAPPDAVSYEIPRFKGEMVSMTGVGQQTSPGFAQTTLGVQSRLGDTWQLGFRGNLHRIDDPTDDERFGPAAAESSVMSMELRSSPTDAYRLASTKSWWRYSAASGRAADVRSHNFEWEHGAARVHVRYFAQENLFLSEPFGSDLIEIAGDAPVVQTRRNDIGVSFRVMQESVRNDGAPTLRSADLTANGAVTLVPKFAVHYGLSSRVGMDGAELAPRAGAEWKVTRQTSVVGTAMVRMIEANDRTALPSVVVITEGGRNLPRYSYSLGFVSGEEGSGRFSAVATVTAVESPLRVLFNDGYEQFWDGLFIDSGDVRRDVRIALRKDIGRKMAIDLSTSAGTATPSLPGHSRKSYITGDVQSIFLPTGTSLAISYHGIQQPQQARGDYRSGRVNVRMAQSLHLPVDLKLLLGLELAHAANSPLLLDTVDENGATRRYLGGLAVNF